MPAWVNLANLFTLLRLALTPFVISDIIHGRHFRALVLFFVAAVTDVIDGAVARSSNGITQAGAYLDPVADKCLMSGVFLALWAADSVPGWFVGVVFGRDLFILTGVLAALGLTKIRKFPPSQWGKLSTFVQIVTAVSWMTQNTWPNPIFLGIATIMIWLSVLFALASGADYAWRGIHLLRAR